MLAIAGYEVQQKLHEGAQSLVYSGRRLHDERPVVLKLIRDEYPSPERVARFRQEYETTRRLNLEGVIKVYGLEQVNNRPVIILEDFGGVSLGEYSRTVQLQVGDWLRLAIQMAEALGQIHQQQVMHKDINPSNLVVNPASQQLKVIDFGISTVLSRETAAFSHPSGLEGTLAYMSPEQTGRMNRAVDYRTDYYSLGATLYEVMTGRLPFPVNDVLELVHCHIARQAVAPHQIRPDIPRALSDIVMKLLAKNAEARYLSAYGLRMDLEDCLRQWQSQGAIEPFALGRHDISDRLQLPQILYGRQQEIATLLEAFERVSRGAVEVMLVAGYAGIGKSALVQEVQKPITARRGYFIAGKFDQFQRDIPYTSLIQAFRSLVRQLLVESEEELGAWRQKLVAALGQNGQVVIEVIGEIEWIMGPQPAVPALPPVEAQNRFHRVFQNFIRVFARPEHPLVLFLDDLQWADAATLNLLQNVVTGPDSGYLLLVGAYRDNEVNPVHPLMRVTEEIEKAGAAVHQINLSPLARPDVAQLVADTVQRPVREVGQLADLLLAKTNGNPFFLNEFLKSLYTENLLQFNVEQGRWQWDLELIQKRGLTDNVVELMAGKVQRLGEETQQVLKLAACIGNRFDLQTLAVVHQKSVRQTATDLWEAIVAGLVVPLDDAYKLAGLEVEGLEQALSVEYKFAHDRIQQATYSLIADADKETIHWRVGRLLLRNTAADKRDQQIFDIANQLNQGRTLATGQAERDELAELNRQAGQKAKASAAYRPAFNYFQVGLEVLGVDGWQRRYDLALALYIAAAEAAYLSGEYEAMEQYVTVVLERAANLLDKVSAYDVRIQAYVTQLKPLEAIQAALDVLKLLGVDFPAKPGRATILRGLLSTRLLLRGKSIDTLANLPEMSDPTKLAIIRVTSRVFSAAFRSAPPLFLLFVFEVIRLSVRYGNTPLSAFAYACYGLILCSVVGNIEQGYAFGQLALRLLERFDAKMLVARTYMVVNTFIRHWKEHSRATLEPVLEGHERGLETGDFEFAAYLAYVYIRAAYLAGEELNEMARKAASYHEVIVQLKQKAALNLNQIYWQVIMNLLGESENPCRLIGRAYNEEIMLPEHCQNNDRTAIANAYFNKSMLCYWFHDYEQALENVERTAEYADGGRGSSFMPHFHFYDSLVRLATAAKTPAAEQKKILKRVAANQKKLKKWAGHAPDNYRHQFLLVEAERLRVLGQTQAAAEKYDEAIAQTQASQYLNEEAMAQEVTARFYLGLGRTKVAQSYLLDARYAYLRWGAKAKVRHLDETYPELLPFEVDEGQELLVTRQLTRSRQSTTTTGRRTGTLDLDSFLKASQAIAGDIVLESLLAKLMRIAIENAGAQKGFLILEQDGQWLIEAAGAVDEEEVAVLASIPVAQAADQLPLSIINYVARSRESVVLNDASREGPFTADPYILAHQPKSVLCAPLANQGKLTGLLYLENELTAGAFTANRLEILNLLSTQAAISIENARLYTNLEAALGRQVQLTNAYSRFVPREILRFLGKESILELHLGDQIQKEMTVLFSDIRTFTGMSEQMTPQENFNFINGYLGRVSPVIRQHNGFIDKYIGDAIMALFPGHPQDALEAAIAMQQGVAAYNENRRQKARPPIRIGVGLHCGRVMLGTVGETARMEGTVISDAVNLAYRLEELTKLYGAAILVSEQTYNSLDESGRYTARFLGRVRVKGKTEVVAVLEILDGAPAEEAALKQQSKVDFECGLRHYLEQQMEEARHCFERVTAVHPADQAAQLYLRRVNRFLEYGIPADWEGVEVVEEE